MKNNHLKHQTVDPASDLAHGFKALERLSVLDGQDRSVELLVPHHLAEALFAEELAKYERDRQEAQKAAKLELDRREKTFAKAPEEPGKTNAPVIQGDRASNQKAIWAAHSATPHGSRRDQKYPVFQPDEGLALHQRMGRYNKEDRERYQLIYDQMLDSGQLRLIARPSSAALRELALSQPHMAAVVEFVRDQIVLAQRARKPLRLPPVLLVGEPGIGKTHFAQGLAKALSAPLSIQRLDSDLTGALFLGSDRKWGNTQHGLLFELLVLGKAANPVVVLDEIDKINRTTHKVQSSLYSLLEPVSARQLRDISLEFEFDASLVTWIATANDATRLDDPLRSRFKEFHIQVPNAQQCLVLAREVIRATIRDTGVRGFSVETSRLERYVAHLPARHIQQLTREAMARALRSGRTSLQRQDLPPALLDSHPSRAGANGYLH
ncbi:AAA family ATPase [Caenimonas soli]|uniref:AAA family ATPase n=1 Tax=Caenimonas soli TaxID=2735555 RepID=UPI0015548393|nr:AAA family ATPase [Caenimonas soli]NPC59346.1 AAA family ATPase [Caenimonas soli]